MMSSYWIPIPKFHERFIQCPGQVRHLGFEFQTHLRIGAQKSGQVPTIARQSFQHQRIGKFPRVHPVAAAGLGCEGPVQFRPQIVLIGPDLEHPVLKIGLENTVRTAQGTVFPDVDDLVATATVMAGQ